MQKAYFFWFLALLIPAISGAQSNSTFVEKNVLIRSDTTVLDSFPILAGSLRINGADSSTYRIDHDRSLLIYSDDYPADSVTVAYRRILFPHQSVFRRKDPSIQQRFFTKDPFSYIPPSQRYGDLKEDQLTTVGNISRGIGFGNNQDVVVNSNLNLKLNGTIGSNVNVLAAVSDENNPIQPEGNTQQLQDFDRVYISMWTDSTSLTVGDFPMNSDPGTHFMKYQKRSRGLQFDQKLRTGNVKWNIEGEGAVSRGRFTRNIIDAIEGNQGPYRLRGANDELFIIVIAGTEKVYLDGELLERGQQNDYTIDYNAGEITFMPRRILTAYSRIIVEFQYSDRNYARSVFRLGSKAQVNRWQFYTHYYSEQDHKNQPFQQDLDAFDSINNIGAREVLAQTGDAGNAFISSAREVDAFNTDRILYVKKDTLGFGEIFEQAGTSSEDGNFYQVIFSFVGEGNGNYREKTSNANGKVYEWVEPLGGEAQGSYEPVEVLIAPERQQLLTLGGIFQPDSNTSILLEYSRSVHDLNTFSSIDEGDNGGTGLYLRFDRLTSFGSDSSKRWSLGLQADYELADKNFRYIERYRNVEFDRKWNRTLRNENDIIEKLGDEHIANASITLQKGRAFKLAIEEGFFRRARDLDGWQQNVVLSGELPKWQYAAGSDNLRAIVPFGEESYRNVFNSYSAGLSSNLGGLIIGGSIRDEQSVFEDLTTDSLQESSFQFTHWSAFVRNSDSARWSFEILYNERADAQVVEGGLKPFTLGQDLSARTGWRQGRDLKIDLIGTYRLLESRDTSLQDEETVQGRLEIAWNGFKRLIQTRSYYQIGTGQEQRREFSYLRVGDGNGIYIWNDYDSNGLQSLDEFVVASEYDRSRANFIRQFTPVQGLVKTYTTEFNNSTRIRVRGRSESDNAFVGIIRRFSIFSNTRIVNKVNNNASSDFINPFYREFNDSALLSSASTFRNVLSFNRADPIFGADIQWLVNKNKTLLVNGFDQRSSVEQTQKFRLNISRKWELNARYSFGDRSHISEFLGDRSFNYRFEEWEPSILFYIDRNFRVGVNYEYFQANNSGKLGGGNTFNHAFKGQMRLNVVNKGSIRSEIALVDVNFRGEENSALGYALLEGLKNGRNITWNLNLEQRFASNVQAMVTYDGRSSTTGPVIHIGRVQVRYLF